MNDDEIISQMELSPENGFKLLFDKYYNYTYTIVYHILHNNGSQMDIEECVSDVLSDVMVSYDTKHGDTLKAYIGTSARRRAIYMSRLLSRKSARHTSIDDENINELASADNVEENVANSELARQILDKIEELGSPDADILIQKYLFDRNSTEIARVLKMNPITVRSRCSRAVKRLKAMLAYIDIL